MHLQLAQQEDPRALTITTELTRGTMMRKFRSRVGVREKAPGVCELEMEMFMQPAIFVPFGIRHMVGGQVRRQLRGVLSSLHQRFDQAPAAKAAWHAPPRLQRSCGAGAGGGAPGLGAFALPQLGGDWLAPLQPLVPFFQALDAKLNPTQLVV
ncbi:MAG: hypothetical protein J3K34DRAFT_249615 [Monoraphidium minutum]|nr:MAG: hypothetical protein J3K34DRAFT_249615 [Monoraphidium minutum]